MEASGSTFRRASYLLALVFTLMAAGIIAAGALSHRHFETRYRRQIEDQLSSIANLKKQELMRWRANCAGDAEMLYRNRAFSRLVARFLRAPGDAEAGGEISEWLGKIQEAVHADRVCLHDARGEELLALPEGAAPSPDRVSHRAREMLRSGRIFFEDFFRDEHSKGIYLSILVPILDAQTGRRVIGFVGIRIDPRRYLYPLLERWPVPSDTAETLLVRREGDEIVYLNNLRFDRNAALTLRVPVSRQDRPPVMAVSGREGIVEGMGYRGVPVLAHVGPVPDSPWFMIARTDMSEVYAPIRRRGRTTLAIVASFLIAAAALIFLLWRREGARFYRERYRTAEEMLRISSRHNAILSAVTDIVMETDARRVYTWANRAGYEFFGEDVIGKEASRYFAGEQDTYDKVELLFEGNESVFYVESWQRRRDGENRLLAWWCKSVKDSTGRVVGAVSSARDITEQKRAETRLSYMSKYANDFIFLVDEEFRVLETNERVMDFYGYTKDEMRGMHATRLRAPGARADFAAQIERARKTGCSLFETVHQRKDGVQFPVEINLRAIDVEGKRFYQAVIRDITERRRADDALRETQDLLNDVGRIAKIGGWKMDLITRRAVWTQGTYEIVEIERGRPIPGPDDHLDYYLPEYRPMVAEAMRALIEDDTPLDFQAPLRTARGKIKWCRAMGRARRRDGKAIELYGTFQDITERREAGEKAREMERRFLHAQKLESLGVLAGGIAHDFNNLLTAILGNLDLALNDLSPLSVARRHIDAAVAATRRADGLTRQMLAYSGKGRFVVQGVDVSELVEENAHIFRAAIAKNVTLNLLLAEDLPSIAADVGQIQQVVMNLITNASEAVGDTPGIVSLSTGTIECDEEYLGGSRLAEKAAPGKYVYLEVVDTGCGMDAETQQRLFDPFFTTKFTGRGLGMSAVLGIMRGHGGAILVESREGKGTAIRVLFPVPAEAVAKPGGGTRAAPARSSAAGAPRRAGAVLVVDDEEFVRAACSAMLGHLGWKTLAAADGDEAVSLLRARPDEVACVILDLTMPKMSGEATFEALRRLKPSLPIILSSGFDEQEAAQRFGTRGIGVFIKKPYDVDTLAASIDTALRGDAAGA